MSTSTKRVTLTLFLIATFVSFWGLVETLRQIQAALKAWPGADLDNRGLHGDLLIALAFMIGSLSLVSRKATRILMCILALPWMLLGLVGVFSLVRKDAELNPSAGIFLINVLFFAIGLWAVFRKKLNLIPLLSLFFVSNQLLLPRLIATRRPMRFDDPGPWSFVRESWWHLGILSLVGLLFLWTFRTLSEEWSGISAGSEGEGSYRILRARLAFYSLNICWIALVGYLSLALHVFGLTPTQVRLDRHLQFQETRLAKIPFWRWYSTIRREEHRIPSQSTVWFSPDGRTVAFLVDHVSATGRKWAVVHGGVEDPAFDEIGELSFNPTGSNLVYAARDGNDWFVYREGQRGPRLRGIVGLYWINEGREITYQGRVGSRWDITATVVGDRVWPPGGFNSSFVKEDGSMGQVQSVDGSASAILDGKTVFQCARDARLLTWWAAKEFACIESRNHKQVVIFHGKAGPGVDQIIYPDGPFVSPNGKQIAYRAEDEGKEFVVVGDRIVPFKPCSTPSFGPDNRATFLACNGPGYFLVVDGTPWPYFQEGSLPNFSPNGQLIAYQAGENGRRFMVVNGKKQREFDRVDYRVEFATQGDSYAYIAWRSSKAFVVVGDTPGPEFAWVDEPLFSPRGNQVAYRAGRNFRQFIVAAGKESAQFDWVSAPVFSPDGRKVAFTAADGRELWLKVMDIP